MEKVNLNNILKDLETKYIKEALTFTGDNITKASELLGLKRTSLTMRLGTLGIEIKRPRYVVKEKNGIANAFMVRHSNNVEDELWKE
jgi:hypothetical protein